MAGILHTCGITSQLRRRCIRPAGIAQVWALYVQGGSDESAMGQVMAWLRKHPDQVSRTPRLRILSLLSRLVYMHIDNELVLDLRAELQESDVISLFASESAMRERPSHNSHHNI